MSALDVAMLAGWRGFFWPTSNPLFHGIGSFLPQDEQAWRVLRQPARRVAQWRAQYHRDECVLILPNDDFGATALGAKRTLMLTPVVEAHRYDEARRFDRNHSRCAWLRLDCTTARGA